jgi:acyl-CoA synthetase (AMP-forming)/AMP-acid ligase II/enoyl-CoA hydratase/carnithine racemase
MTLRLKTTRPVTTVRTIADIAAIEAAPYDELVTARNVYDLLLATAEHVGEGKALTVLRSPDPSDVGAAHTHLGLLGEVTRAANLFHALGLGPGAGVAAFLAPTLPELPALMLGAEVAGIAASLNYLLTPEAIVDLLTATGATILVVPARRLDATCWTKAEAVFGRVPSLRLVVVIGDDTEGRADFIGLGEVAAAASRDRLAFAPSDDRNAVCALFHTGGTTGRPKLVQLTHGNQIHAAFGFAQVYGYDEFDTVVSGFPFFHVGGTITVGLSVLAAGGHVVVPSPYALRPPAAIERYWDIVERFGATVVSGVPTSIAAITNTFRPRAGTTVRMAVTGGAVLPKAVGQRFETTTGIEVFETYGMTEAAAAIAFNPGRGARVPGSAGLRAPYSAIRIRRLDPADPGLCGPNESGVVQIRGPQIFPGYLDPTQTADVLDADGWLTTGDVGYLRDDERLVLTGRERDMIVRSGHNIDPAAIEDVANQFPGVSISAAVGMPDQYAGEVPALFVVATPGSTIDRDALKAHLEAHVHEGPALPKLIKVIDALPVTAVGKVFKPALRDMAVAEKVAQEVARVCGPAASAEVTVSLDSRRNTLVDVAVRGASAEALSALDAALAPLPQTYAVRPDLDPQDVAVTLTVDGAIATLTLNRPQSLNALSNQMMTALERHLRVLAGLPGLRAVVLTGAGRAFSAGGDLIEFEAALATGGQRLLDLLAYNQDVIQMIEDLPVPVIGAVNGLAVAGGLELLLCCDILIATEGATLGDGHTRYGVVPAGGATVRLTERLTPARAAQLFYTAGMVDAATAAMWGLVNEVVPTERLMARALEIARQVSECSPEAIRHVKALTGRAGHSAGRQARLRAEIDAFARHLEGQDLVRGLAAFRAKHQPRY